MPEVIVQPTEYYVGVLPQDDVNASTWSCRVVYRGFGKWAVARGGQCLNRYLEWAWEPSPSSRDDDWLTYHRFELDDAIELAKQVAPHIRVNGKTATEILEWVNRQGGESS
jgi:hypothetical protein